MAHCLHASSRFPFDLCPCRPRCIHHALLDDGLHVLAQGSKVRWKRPLAPNDFAFNLYLCRIIHDRRKPTHGSAFIRCIGRCFLRCGIPWMERIRRWAVDFVPSIRTSSCIEHVPSPRFNYTQRVVHLYVGREFPNGNSILRSSATQPRDRWNWSSTILVHRIVHHHNCICDHWVP